MAIRKVARLGHPVLRQVARPLSLDELRSSSIQTLIDDMVETMEEYGGIGLAAPQVHESVRLVVYGTRNSERGDIPLAVLVNPALTVLTEKTEEDWEGCLSLPDLRGRVPRPVKVQVEGVGRTGAPLRFIAKDYLARVVLHECDHLEGRVFIDRMKDLATLAFLPEFLRYSGVAHDIED